MPLTDNIRARTWSAIFSQLPLSQPYQVDVSDESLCSETWMVNYADSIGPSNHEVFSAPAKSQPYVHDSIFLFLKAEHAAREALLSFHSGRGTWALMDAHHASLLYAKTVCAFFGVHILTYRNRSYVIDYFPEVGAETQRRAFRKKYINIADPIRVMRWRSDLIAQRELWEIFLRIVAVCSFNDSRDSNFELLRQQGLGSHKPERNKILYWLGHWTFPDDILYPSMNLEFCRELRGTLRMMTSVTGTL